MTGSTARPIVVGVTGASGAIYAQRLVRYLLAHDHTVLLAMSSTARLVAQDELRLASGEDPWGDAHRDRLRIVPEKDFRAPFCSGSFPFHGMAIVPTSMGTVGSLAAGVSTNAIHRGAEVALKEKRPLVIVPRETPFSVVHLENLLRLARAGATIVPPSPAFYQHPETLDDLVDFVVSRILDALGIDNELFDRWGSE